MPKTPLAALRRHAIARTFFTPTTLPRAIARLGFVQADPIRAPARAQDLTLRHRVADYRAGDLVMPGRLVLEVHASGPMEVRVRVSEQERANVVEKQTASVHADALPDEPLAARVSSLAGAASRGRLFDDGLSAMRTFDVGLQLDTPDPRLKTQARRCAWWWPARS